MSSEAISPRDRRRLRAIGVADADLLKYLLDRRSGSSHIVAAERLYSHVDPTERERYFLGELLTSLPNLRSDVNSDKV